MRRTLLVAGVGALVLGAFTGPALAQPYVAGVTVEKAVEGEDAPDGAEFEFALTCDSGLDESFTLGDGDARTFGDVPQGAVCELTETVPADADFDDDDFGTAFGVQPESAWDDWDQDARSITFTVPDEDEAHMFVTATNGFGEGFVLGSGELIVSKRVAGDAEGPWEFEVSCPGSVQDTVTLGDGESASFNVTRGIDTVCTITETVPDGVVASYTIDDGDEQVGAEASFVFDDEDVPVEVDLVREVGFVNTPDEDDTGVLADTGFEVTWAMLLAVGLVVPGTGVLLLARRRGRQA